MKTFAVQVWKRVGKRQPYKLPEKRELVWASEVQAEETVVAASVAADALKLLPGSWQGQPRPIFVIRVWPIEKAPLDWSKR